MMENRDHRNSNNNNDDDDDDALLMWHRDIQVS